MRHYFLAQLINALISKDVNRIKQAYVSYRNSIRQENPLDYMGRMIRVTSSRLVPNWLRLQVQKDMLSHYDQLDEKDINNRYTFRNIQAYVDVDTLKLLMDNPASMSLEVENADLFFIAGTYIKAGQLDKAHQIIQQLKNRKTKISINQTTRNEGTRNHYIALLYTMMGQYVKAIQPLKTARNLGLTSNFFNFQYHYLLEPLYDHPEFQELIKPIWPELNN